MTPAEFRAARLKMSLTQKQMTAACGLKSVRAIQQFESGEYKISGPVQQCVRYMLKYGPLTEEKKND